MSTASPSQSTPHSSFLTYTTSFYQDIPSASVLLKWTFLNLKTKLVLSTIQTLSNPISSKHSHSSFRLKLLTTKSQILRNVNSSMCSTIFVESKRNAIILSSVPAFILTAQKLLSGRQPLMSDSSLILRSSQNIITPNKHSLNPATHLMRP